MTTLLAPTRYAPMLAMVLWLAACDKPAPPKTDTHRQ